MAVEYKYNKLRGRIVEKFGSLSAFSEHLDISRVSASYKMNGKVGFTQEDIETWAKLLDIDPDDYGSYFFA